MSSTIKKILLACVLAVAIGGYVYWSSSQSSSVTASSTADPTSIPSGTVGSPSATTAPGSSGGSDPTGGSAAGTSASSGAYEDGTYTGTVANSIYGNVQVSVTIAGGKISDVTFLQHPDSQPHSVEVSSMAMPILESEAIVSQGANVNVVSGATQTSEAFQQTLQSALSQAS